MINKIIHVDACRYEISLLMFNSTFHAWVKHLMRNSISMHTHVLFSISAAGSSCWLQNLPSFLAPFSTVCVVFSNFLKTERESISSVSVMLLTNWEVHSRKTVLVVLNTHQELHSRHRVHFFSKRVWLMKELKTLLNFLQQKNCFGEFK